MRTLQRSGGSGARRLGGCTPWRQALAAGGCVLTLTTHTLADDPAAGPVNTGTSVAPTPASGADEALRRGQRMLLERAKLRYEAGRAAGAGNAARPHLQGALDALHLAYGLSPAPWLLFNMAQVQSQLGACNEASELYQRFLASNPAPAASASARQALELLAACEDGNLAPPPDDSLEPGLFLTSSLASIFQAPHRQQAPAPAPPLAPAEAQETPRLASILPWAFGGLAVMSGVAGVIYWNEAQSAKTDLDRIGVAGPEVVQTQQRGESALDLARVFGGVAAGFALAAAASYWWLEHEPKPETPLAAALGRLSFSPLEGGAAALYQSEF